MYASIRNTSQDITVQYKIQRLGERHCFPVHKIFITSEHITSMTNFVKNVDLLYRFLLGQEMHSVLFPEISVSHFPSECVVTQVHLNSSYGHQMSILPLQKKEHNYS